MAGCKCCESSGKDIRISFCPRCKSQNVGYIFGFGNLFGVMPTMKCKDCGFSNSTFPILIANEAELKKAIGDMKEKRKKKKVVTKKKAVKKVVKKTKSVRKKR